MKFILILLTALLTGCATAPQLPQLSREEWLSITSRTYEEFTKDQIIGAAERLLRLADGDDFNIVQTEEGLYASRNWSIYMVLAATSGTDYWQFRVSSTEKGPKAFVQVNQQFQTITPIATTSGAWTATTMPMAGSPVLGTAIYDIFWSRMDYLLGRKSDWMTCKVADERVKQKTTWGANDALCNSFNVKDQTPESPIVRR